MLLWPNGCRCIKIGIRRKRKKVCDDVHDVFKENNPSVSIVLITLCQHCK